MWVRLGFSAAVVVMVLAGCGPREGEACDAAGAAEAFLAANDAGDVEEGLRLAADDVALMRWASGANGYLMGYSFAVGKTQVGERLGEEGLRRAAVSAERPGFTLEALETEGNVVRFLLMPDREREDGRPFNHFAVTLVFTGCRIELIKVVERVTWL